VQKQRYKKARAGRYAVAGGLGRRTLARSDRGLWASPRAGLPDAGQARATPRPRPAGAASRWGGPVQKQRYKKARTPARRGAHKAKPSRAAQPQRRPRGKMRTARAQHVWTSPTAWRPNWPGRARSCGAPDRGRDGALTTRRGPPPRPPRRRPLRRRRRRRRSTSRRWGRRCPRPPCVSP